ncbi:MAG: diguanylate cyclase (GGDEF)-like protein/PAS domain S-box-containing protein [Thalassolituus sp.]|jgi:diguanylate cyclase (GGDEF)-like protein/PAS domain S-box-containing protein
MLLSAPQQSMSNSDKTKSTKETEGMTLFKTQSLRRRLVLISLITTGLTLLLANFAYISLEYYLARQDTENKLEVLGEVISDRITAALTFNDRALLESNLDTLQSDSSIVRGCIYHNDQSLAASYHSAEYDRLDCPTYLPRIEAMHSYNFSRIFPVKRSNEVIGTLYIESSRRQLLDRFFQFLGFSLVIILSAFAVAFMLANKLKDVISHPMRELSGTLTKILNNKNYSIRATKTNNDELGALVDLFNRLLSTIEDENQSLKTSEERFRKLTALSPVGIFQVDPDQRLRYVNQRWRDIHGVTNEQPDLQDWFEMISPRDMVNVHETWNRMVMEQESIALEIRLVRSDQSHTWIHLMASALHDRDGALLGYLGAISDISELKAAQIQMETLAFYDPLTGLANRRLFKNRLENSVKSVLRSGQSMALMFLDMDQFKRVNDTLGHDAGDILLKEVSNRLSNTVRENDTVSRVGGDEFTILLTDIRGVKDVRVVADKILKSLAKPIRVKGQDIITSVSIGITMTPEDSTDINTLMKNADLAMYSAKEHGRNNYQFFSEEMNHSILEHLALEKEISEALQRDQFRLVFQPKVSLFDYRTTGVETLIRWEHPEKGLIPPDYFIPVAEETGQIIDIGNWVLEQACRQISTLLLKNIMAPDAKVAVNLSAKQFSDPLLPDRIREVLDITKIPPRCLELELTESTLMEDVESAIKIMQDIKNTGVSIAIDDFGTGYSSLAYIKRFPIDVLKVDRSFVMDIPEDKNDMAITAAVIAMAHKLSLNVVAEGVETEEQLKYLRQNNCDEGQGYFFSRPLSLGQLHQYLIVSAERNTNSYEI